MSIILNVKEKLKSRRLHTGKEQAVFALSEGTGGLLNIHKALMDKVFNEGGNIKYLLYSPIYFSETTPFKAKSLLSSSALLAADNKFIITKNYHSFGKYPEIYMIDFKDILTLELGMATLMGWFRIEFAHKYTKEEVSVIFAASSGMIHFSNLIKVYTDSLNRLYPADDIHSVYKNNGLFNLLMNNILLLLRIDKFSVWENKKNIFGIGRRKLISAACTIFAGERGIVIVEKKGNGLLEESNASFIPYSKIRGCRNEIYGSNVSALVLDVDDIGSSYEIVFDSDRQHAELMCLARTVSEKINCFSGNTAISLWATGHQLPV